MCTTYIPFRVRRVYTYATVCWCPPTAHRPPARPIGRPTAALCQSGDDDILRDMARGYTAQRFKEIVAQIRSRLPDAAITADAIVGFPGETEEQFENTLQLMPDVKFDQLNTAAYSPRPHTPAALWTNQVTPMRHITLHMRPHLATCTRRRRV